jgi:integrase
MFSLLTRTNTEGTTTLTPAPLAQVLPIETTWQDHVTAFIARYQSANTRKCTRQALTTLFINGGQTLRNITEDDLIAAATYSTKGRKLANNTVYGRASTYRQFFAWCQKTGRRDENPAEALRDRYNPLASFTRTYGGAQAAHPKHWLTREQAYADLIDACRLARCPELALRDEIALRLGLAGLRRFEIASLTVAHVARLPRLNWTGKRNKPRNATLHPRLCEALRWYLALYPDPKPTDPLLCPANCHSTALWWHRPLGLSGLYKLVARKGTEAGISYLGVHDLRRTAAGLLHSAKTEDGAHIFDLLDIQQVLGHSDPVVTMKCYLEPINTATLDKAASYLG